MTVPEPVSGAVIDTTLLDGKLKLRQLQAGHRAGTDAILLSALVGDAIGVVVDVGAGAGAAGLSVALRNSSCDLLLAEIEPALAAIARQNITLNDMSGRARVIAADILDPKSRIAAGLLDNCADILITNPPYQQAGVSRVSPDTLKARAHTFSQMAGGPKADLDTWLRACAAMLRPGGNFAMIHRADALDEVLGACSGRFGALEILPIYPKLNRAANRILIHGKAGSRGPVSILPGLVLHEDDGSFTARAAAIHAGQAIVNH